jgi:chaperonin GroES
MATIRPLYDRILVKRVKADERSKGGIIIPTTAQEKATEAEVIAVGKGKLLDDGRILEPSVKKGDKILFGKYTGNEVKIDGEDHLILREDDILGVLINDK